VRAAEREAVKALHHDRESPWPLIVLARCAIAEGRAADAIDALTRARLRAPQNGYVISLLETAQQRAAITRLTALSG
jgi:cytochrome c-type biogenesis protein CcmH/NrfG